MNAGEHVVPEGDEPPPRGVKIMAWVRWGLIGTLALVALYSVIDLRPTPPTATQVANAEKWQCPMHPQVVRDGPGKCPICGMDLVRVDNVSSAVSTENVPELTRVELPLDRVQRLGVRTAKAEEKTLSDVVHTVGVLVASESRTAQVNTRFSGWVEETLVRETGAAVHKGDPLARIYSPEVLQAYQEHKAASVVPKNDPLSLQIQRAAAQRLQLLGLDPSDVTNPESTRPTVTLHAPRDGFITLKNAVDGAYVTPGTPLFEVSDLSVLWLMVDIREDALARVAVGQKAVATFPALPDLRLEGRVAYLYPSLDTVTRTLKARIELPNPKGLLRTGLAANVDVKGAPWKGVVIPADAVVQTGRATYVFVRTAERVFEPRAVTLGQQLPDGTEIRSGVAAGEDVVTGALFLLDSESRMRAALQRRP